MTAIFEEEDGNTPLSPEEQLDLIPPLTTRGELNQAERLNINEARVWGLRRSTLARDDIVTDVFGRELHKRMFNQVWKWAGRYRVSEKNLGWEPHRLTEGVRNVFDDAKYWLANGTFSIEEAAVRFHYQLVQVHPWPNGNGRHARLMADIIMAASAKPELTWGARTVLAAKGAARAKYLEAIRMADAGNFVPLIAFAKS